MIRPWSHIMIHHSLTKDTGTVSWRAIRDYHVKTLGWWDIGYHFGIERVGDGYEVMKGRWLSIRGAHCKGGGMNGKAIGICVVGNYDLEPPTMEILNITSMLVMELQELFNIPKEGLTFHRFFADKSCPGRLFTYDMLGDLII